MEPKIIIIGGGMIGLSIAHQLIERNITSKITIIEKEESIGLHSSGRNSGVLHAGIYYKPNSLRAKVCINGSRRLKNWIEKRNLPLNKCGKLIVPQEVKLDSKLDMLENRGKENGAEVEIIDEERIKRICPIVKSASGRGLWSPNTCVTNPKLVLNRLEKELSEKGVRFLKSRENWQVDPDQKTINFNEQPQELYRYDHLYNCAGLFSDKIAHRFNIGLKYSLIPFKGIYWELKDQTKFEISTNIYPVPDIDVPFLGVHFTPNADSSKVTIGPTATLALGRENYNLLEKIEPKKTINNVSFIIRQYIQNKGGFRNYVHDQLPLAFEPFLIKSAQQLIPKIRLKDIKKSSKVGIRAQLYDFSKNSLQDDFLCITENNSTHVLNAISPAFTASFELADHIINLSHNV